MRWSDPSGELVSTVPGVTVEDPLIATLPIPIVRKVKLPLPALSVRTLAGTSTFGVCESATIHPTPRVALRRLTVARPD
jgi:hypothetical protein